MTFAVWAGVFVIGGFGAVGRFLVDRAVSRRVARGFPFGTLAVNLPANSRPGQKIRLKGRGIPAKEAGDLYLVLNMVVPPCRTDADKAAWQALAAHYAGFDPGASSA